MGSIVYVVTITMTRTMTEATPADGVDGDGVDSATMKDDGERR